MYEYILKMNSNQAKEVLKSVELLMRIKLGQYQEITWVLTSDKQKVSVDQLEYADECLKKAFEIYNSNKQPSEYKDDEWYRLYNLYQVLRKAIHDAENPEGKGIDAQEPMQLTKEPLPEIKWIKNGDG